MPKKFAEKMAALAEAFRKATNAGAHFDALASGPLETDAQIAAADKAFTVQVHALIVLNVQVAAALAAYGESLEAEEKAAVQMDQTLRSLA